MTNTLAYQKVQLITRVISYIVQTPGDFQTGSNTYKLGCFSQTLPLQPNHCELFQNWTVFWCSTLRADSQPRFKHQASIEVSNRSKHSSLLLKNENYFSKNFVPLATVLVENTLNAIQFNFRLSNFPFKIQTVLSLSHKYFCCKLARLLPLSPSRRV